VSIEWRSGTDGASDAFLDLPAIVYRDDPRWIPEEASIVARAFSRENAWFDQGEAATLCLPGEARLAVFINGACTIDGERAAFFGYWEQTATAASARLFDAAADWARARGCTMLYGPIDFTSFGRYRVSLGSEPGGLPFPGEPYQAPGYAETLTALGFHEVRRYATQLGPTPREAVERKRPALDSARAAGYSFETLDARAWLAFVPELYAVADSIFGDGFAYTPVSRAYFEAGYAESVARRLCPHTSLVARAADGSLAGFLLAFPHYGPLAVQGAARDRVPASRLSFAEHAARLCASGERTAIAKTAGVMPEHRRRGVLDAMSVLAIERGLPHYDRWMAALVRDGNASGRFGAPYSAAERSYALYARRVGSDA